MKTCLAVLTVVASLAFVNEAEAGWRHRARAVYYGHPAYYAPPIAYYGTPRVARYYNPVVVAPRVVVAPPPVIYRPVTYRRVYPVSRASYYYGW